MTIGIVISKPPSYSETFFMNKILGLKKSGFEVVLFVQKKDDLFELCETRIAPKVYEKNVLFQCIEFSKASIKLLFKYRQIKKFIELERKTNRPWKQVLKNVYNNTHILTSKLDWLHFGFATMALQSEHVAKAIDSKMSISCRGYDLDVYPLKHKNVYGLVWNNVDKVHLISKYMLEQAYVNGMSKNTDYEIIYPAIDITRFEQQNVMEDKSILRITTIARLHWIKGLNATLEALSIIKKKGILFEYNIIGDGPDLESLIFTTHQLNLENEVKFSGKIEHDQVINNLVNTDIYVQFSLSEGFCNAVIEAQALGLMCIVSDGGALPENVIHEQTGWVVPKRNPERLADTILKVINLPNVDKMKIRKNAQERVKKEFNLVNQQNRFQRFYD